MSTQLGIQGITEDDIANYLANTPGFFERHAELLAAIQLTSPHGQRAVSLQERQMEMLRDKNKALEMRLVDMIRHGQENLVLSNKLDCWVRELLLTGDPGDLPEVLVAELQHQFAIPQAGVRVWGAAEVYEDQPFAQPPSAEAQSFARALTAPHCGVNTGFEAVAWFNEPQGILSMALIPLRQQGQPEAFGVLALGSPDPTRYAADMGTEFLVRIGDVASAALSRLLPVKD